MLASSFYITFSHITNSTLPFTLLPLKPLITSPIFDNRSNNNPIFDIKLEKESKKLFKMSSFQTLPNQGPPAEPGMMMYPTTPTTTTSSTSNYDPSGSSDHSSGSFSMVFVVLAIILVISAVACVVGRLCGKKSNKSSKSNHSKPHKNKGQGKNNDQYRNHNNNYNPNNLGGFNPNHMMNHHQANPKGGNPHKHGGMPHGGHGRPKNPDLEFGYRSKEGDIMLGFDPKSRMIPSSKVAHNSGDFRVDSMGRGGMHNMEPHHNMDPREFP